MSSYSTPDRVRQSVIDTIDEWNTKVGDEICCPIAALFWRACVLELTALKPGNVHCYAAGHEMTVEHFLASAHAVVGVIEDSPLTLAQKIYQSVKVTQQSVSTNTNLGIILLCVPIVQASTGISHKELQQLVKDVLDDTDVADAQLILEAIRLAAPSGLGQSKEHDVHDSARADIRSIMTAAQNRDTIARQYANGYSDIFDFGFRSIDEGMDRGLSESDLVTEVYLSYLSEYPDSHIVRQHGDGVAEEVKTISQHLYSQCRRTVSFSELHDELLHYDFEWKQRSINPGTSADMTVSTLFAYSIVNGVN